ncbi:MAG: AgmX/PglI C-terminal domain-containing protein [Candidatus Binatia bacterium]
MRNKRALVALASCVFGIGMILWGFRMGADSPQQEVSPETAAAKPKKNQPRWQVALGNVVVFAPELGFSVKAFKDEDVDTARISAKIESQLAALRDVYREESENNPNLMGGILLQLAIDSSGEVSNVKEIASRIPDGDFKKDLLESVSRWDFREVVSSPVVISCPLLLVREGMDITTVMTWEKSLGMLEDKSALARASAQLAELAKSVETQKQVGANRSSNEHSRQQKPNGKSNSNLFEIRTTTPVRKEPSYKSSSISQVVKGTKIVVIGVYGDWLEIHANGTSGFIRKEFVSTVD